MTEGQYEQFDRTVFQYALRIIDRELANEITPEQSRKYKDKLIEWLRVAESKIEVTQE